MGERQQAAARRRDRTADYSSAIFHFKQLVDLSQAGL